MKIIARLIVAVLFVGAAYLSFVGFGYTIDAFSGCAESQNHWMQTLGFMVCGAEFIVGGLCLILSVAIPATMFSSETATSQQPSTN